VSRTPSGETRRPKEGRTPKSDAAKAALQRLETLAKISEEPGRLTRTFCSPAMRRANDLVGRWMRQAGMEVREDPVGNLLGRYPAQMPELRSKDKKTLLLGSHLDTVRNAGKFDGALGVVLALACVEELKRRKKRMPFAIEVVGFADEEGVRYQSAYLGSRAMAGKLGATDLKRTDPDGISMAEAIRRFGGKPERLKDARNDGKRLLGYVEAHIEQGPLLEDENLALGVGTAIAGQSRFRVVFSGQAGHAGTTPMRSRHDALCAAAVFILAVEKQARETAGLVATVGQIQTEPGASNVIPGTVTLTLDVRHERDPARKSACIRLQKMAKRIGAGRGVKVSVQPVQQTPSVRCSRGLSDCLKRAALRHQRKVLALPSGAGHDAAIMARITPAAMLFIRCRRGISHHPAESVKLADVRVALKVLVEFLELLSWQVGHAGRKVRLRT
jgi:allantoate deiminase